MKVGLTHCVEYDTLNESSVDDIIASLLGSRSAIQEAVWLIEACIDGLVFDDTKIHVQELSQKSPLKEVFFLTLFLTYQNDLERNMPEALEMLTGIDVPEKFNALITVAVLVILFTGVDYLMSFAGRSKKTDAAISQLSSLTGKSFEDIKQSLDERYPDTRSLGRMAIDFFRPSKRQNNARIKITDTVIPTDIIEKIPENIDQKTDEVTQTSEYHEKILIQFHAQDLDRPKSGWAAVLPTLSKDRVRMKILPPLKPEEIYNKRSIYGDILIIYNIKNDNKIMTECHLIRVSNFQK